MLERSSIASASSLVPAKITSNFLIDLENSGNLNVIIFCQQAGFCGTHYSCPTCNAMMKLTSRNDSSDGFCWRCRLDGSKSVLTMFINSQDTFLLHDVLVSAVNWIKSHEESTHTKTTFNLEAKAGAVDLVASTILRLSSDSSKVETESDLLERQLHVNRRLHAAVFFVALRSNGIACSEATKYYETIAYTFPSLDWKFYLKLSLTCDWSEYFIECAQQLEPNILAAVIKMFLSIHWESDSLKYYTWHLALQSIIWKFFIIEDPTICDLNEHCAFVFPFSNTRSGQVSNKDKIVTCDNPARSQVLHAFVTLLNRLLSAKSSLGNFDFVKIIYHGYKTIFQLLRRVGECKGDSVKELFRLNILLKQCGMEEPSQSVIKSELNLYERSLLNHCYVTTSWNINGNYLIFLLCNYWNDVLQKISNSPNVPFSSVLSLFPSNVEKEAMMIVCPLFKEHFEVKDEHHILFLKTVIHHHYPCASRAASILLVHPEVRMMDEILRTLEEHVSILSPFDTYTLLANAVKEADSKETQIRFLNLFYKILSQASPEIYNETLVYIFNQNGNEIDEHFKLPNFDAKLTQFVRKTMLLQEAEICLLPLFVQSPSSVLKSLLEQALMRGPEGMTIIPILKHIPSACYYKGHFPLATELSHYFSKSELEPHEAKNIVDLIKTIMEVQVKTDIMPFDTFLKQCIVPNLSQNRSKRIDMTLECINVALKVLVSKETLKTSTDSFLLMIESVAAIIDTCIKSGNGKRKELALDTLSFLFDHQNLTGELTGALEVSLQTDLDCFDPIVYVYMLKLLGNEAYQGFVNKSIQMCKPLWTFCCCTKDTQFFREKLSQKKISYEQLLNILIPLLSHFTKEEWIWSAHLIKECYENFFLVARSCNFPWLLPQSDRQLYTIIRCLMDCYYFIIHQGLCDIHYVTSCFTNTVMGILNQEDTPQLLLNVLLDTCHLTSMCKTDILPVLSSFIIGLKKSICLTCKDKLVQENYLKLLLHGVKTLPNSDGKSSLLQKL